MQDMDSHTNSSNQWQFFSEPFPDPYDSSMSYSYPQLYPQYPQPAGDNASCNTYQPFIEDEADLNWSHQQLQDMDWDVDYNPSTFPIEPDQFNHDLYAYDEASVLYPYTISDGSSSSNTSVPSTPRNQHLADTWQLRPEERCFEIEDADLVSTLPHNTAETSSLPHLNNSQPILGGQHFQRSNFDAPSTVDPQYLHAPSPRIKPVSPSFPPSPSPPLPSPLSSCSDFCPPPKQSQQSFENTLKDELRRRHQADASITRLRAKTAKSRAQADENTKQIEWAKDMLLRFPRESAQIPPARAPSPGAWEALKKQTHMQQFR